MFIMYNLISCFYFWNTFKYDSCIVEAILKIQLASSLNVKYTTDTTQHYLMHSLSSLMWLPEKLNVFFDEMHCTKIWISENGFFFLRSEFSDNIMLTTEWIWNFNKRRYHWSHQNPRNRISVHKSRSTKLDGAWWGSFLYLRDHVLRCVRLFVTLWAVAHQATLSVGFPRLEYWSGLPLLPPGDLPNPGIEPESLASPALAGRFFSTVPPGWCSHLQGRSWTWRWSLCQTDGWREAAASHREPSSVLCDDLEGWEGSSWGRGGVYT